MKSLIVYFSQTGNTKKVACAIHKGVSQLVEQCDIAPIKEVDPRDLSRYDLIGLGSPQIFGVPYNVRGFIDSMGSLQGKHSFAFNTHGALPGMFLPRVVRLLTSRGLIVIGTRDWYGSVPIPYFPLPYFTDGHPDEIDLKEAEDFGKEMVELSRRIRAGETQLIPALPILPRREGKMTRMVSPKLNLEKCRYPECRLCMDNCHMDAIDLSVSPPIFARNCVPCYFCEKICPEGAIEVDYDSAAEEARQKLPALEELLDKAEAEGRFRRLVPLEKIGWDTPYYKVYNKHPRYVIPKEDCISEP